MIIAGEASGDAHAAEVLSQLRQHQPDLKAFGVGGPALRAQGFECIVTAEEINVLGITEIISKLPIIRQAFREVKAAIVERKPDLIMLVDFAGFNLRIAKFAKRHGIKVLYFISPHVWIWRKYRVKTIQKSVDHMALIFPNEAAFYDNYSVANTYVGNPTYQAIQAFKQSSLPASKKSYHFGLLPGSRVNEIRQLLPVMCAAAKQLKQQYPDATFVLPRASTISHELISSLIPDDIDITVSDAPTYSVIQACTAVISASGTVTLEVALLGIPQVIIYKVNKVTEIIGRLFIRLPHYALCNLIAGQEIGKELLQHFATADNIVNEMNRLLNDADYKAAKEMQMTQLQQKFDNKNPAANTAELLLDLVTN